MYSPSFQDRVYTQGGTKGRFSPGNSNVRLITHGIPLHLVITSRTRYSSRHLLSLRRSLGERGRKGRKEFPIRPGFSRSITLFYIHIYLRRFLMNRQQMNGTHRKISVAQARSFEYRSMKKKKFVHSSCIFQ